MRKLAGAKALASVRRRASCKSKVQPNEAFVHASPALAFRFQSKLNERNVSGTVDAGTNK
jgi:hypothetical protein